jgi:hypothetical protein
MITKTMNADEIVTRCLKAASECIDQGDNQAAREQMKITFDQIARDAAPWNLQSDEVVRFYFRPIQEQLADQYSRVVADRIYWDFFDVFWPLWRTGTFRSKRT